MQMCFAAPCLNTRLCRFTIASIRKATYGSHQFSEKRLDVGRSSNGCRSLSQFPHGIDASVYKVDLDDRERVAAERRRLSVTRPSLVLLADLSGCKGLPVIMTPSHTSTVSMPC